MTIFSITSDSEGGGLQPVYISNFTFFHFFFVSSSPEVAVARCQATHEGPTDQFGQNTFKM